MGSKVDVYKAFHEASVADPPASITEANETYLSDDFQNLDQDGNVIMDRQTYIGMTQILTNAFKDFTAVIGDTREEGDSVLVTYHFEGTHTSDLDLSAMGMGVIPASGKEIVWPEADSKITVEGGKIAKLEGTGDSRGMEDFVAALM